MLVDKRQRHDIEQGSDEWHSLRDGYITASTVPTICGYKGKQAYLDLVERTATGKEQVFDDFTLQIFAKGHQYEAMARPDAEEWLESELTSPVFTCEVAGLKLLASLDGLTSDGKHAWECKTLNKKIRGYRTADDIDLEYLVQMNVQMLCSGAQACLFTGANDNKIEHIGLVKYDPDIIEIIVQQCNEFLIDVLNFESTETDNAILTDMLDTYRSLKESQTEITDKLKTIEADIKKFVDGEEQVTCNGFKIAKQVRKGPVDYSSIPVLVGVDLDQYRKSDSEFYVIKEVKK